MLCSTICTLRNVTCAAARWTVRTQLNYLLPRSTDFPNFRINVFADFWSQNLTAFFIDISQIVVFIFSVHNVVIYFALHTLQ
jgi:hypothetical protein